MAMAGEGVEGDIGDDADIRHGLLDRRAGKVDEIVLLEAVRACFVAQFHLDVREGGKRRNAEIGCFLCRLHRLVHGHAVDAGHGRDRLDDAGTGDQEDRPDQIVDGQPVFLHQASGPIGLAVASHAPMSGDLINEVRLVLHDAAILLRLFMALLYGQRTYHAVPRIQNPAKGRSQDRSGEASASYVLFAHGT